MFHRLFIILAVLLSLKTYSADTQSLTKLYQENYHSFYTPRFCGQNVTKLIQEAHRLNINLEGAYALKIEGPGFLATSGFYTRGYPHERAMLGYFHWILVADNMVYDFDLHEPLVLSLEDYTRVQFTPPYEPFIIWGMTYDSKKELVYWDVTRYEWKDLLKNKGTPTWKKKYHEIIDLDEMMSRTRYQ
jgi:hypothetical protein